MDLLKNSKIIISFIILFALIIGIIAIIVLPEFPKNDELGYDKVALNLIQEKQYTVFGTTNKSIDSPGYPVFLALIYKFFGHSFTIVYLWQFLLLGIMGVLIFLIGKNHLNFSNIQALGPALATIMWPYLILFSRLLLTELLFIFLFILSVYLLLNFSKNPTLKKSIILAVVLALAALTRPVIMLLPFWMILFILFFRFIKKKFTMPKSYLYNAITALVIFILLLSPWISYSSYRMSEFTPVSSGFYNVLRRAFINFDYEYGVYKTAGYEPGSEVTAKKIIVSRLKNIYRFWRSGATGYRVESVVNKYPLAKYSVFMYRIVFYTMLSLCLISLIFIKKRKEIFLLWLIIFYFWSVHTVLYPYPRFTLPIIPLVIILAFFTLIKIYQRKPALK